MTNTTTADRTTPEQLIHSFSGLVHAGDLDGLVALYEPAAVFEPEPGTVVAGLDAIREALGAMLQLQPTLTSKPVHVFEADDIALVINEWSMTGTAPDGIEVRREGLSTDVLRRQADGTWLVLIDRP